MIPTEETPERLVIEARPWGLTLSAWALAGLTLHAGLTAPEAEPGARLLAGAIGLALVALAWWALPFVRVVLDREAGHLERRETRLFRTRSERLPLARVRRAREQAEWIDGSRLKRLAVELEDGSIVPLMRAYGPRTLDPLTAQINAWLESARNARAA